MDAIRDEIIAAAVAYEAAVTELGAAILAQQAITDDVLSVFDADARRSLADGDRIAAQARLVRAVRAMREGGE